MNIKDERQGTRIENGVKEERKKQGEKSKRKKSKCKIREGRRRKKQRKMVAPKTARPHQNSRSDADGCDEMRYYPT